MLRSANAAARRREREEQREKRYNQRMHNSANKLLSSLSAEVQSDLRKVENFENKIFAKPIRTLKMEYTPDGEWDVLPLEDNTGKIQFSLAPGFESDPVQFSPTIFDFEGFQIKPLAACVCQYATYMAFSITTTKGMSNLDIVNRSTIEKSRIVLICSDNQIYWPLDETVDGKYIREVPRTGIIAFEPFTEAVTHFDLAFLPKKLKEDSDEDPPKIYVRGNAIYESSDDIQNEEALGEIFLKSAKRKVKKVRRRVNRELQSAQSSTGCFSSFIIILIFRYLADYLILEERMRKIHFGLCVAVIIFAFGCRN